MHDYRYKIGDELPDIYNGILKLRDSDLIVIAENALWFLLKQNEVSSNSGRRIRHLDIFSIICLTPLNFRLVDKINNSIGQDPNSKCLIGVLDIYGFESFKTNRRVGSITISIFNMVFDDEFQHVFKMEQEEYTKEQIDWSYIEFVDNQDVLDLIEKVRLYRTTAYIYKGREIGEKEKPGGIIALLDEACMFPKSTHETFANKLYQTFKTHKHFIKPKLSRTDFTVSHYAGEIGKTKVFLRAGQMAELDGRRAQVLGIAAKSIQRRIRTHQARKHYLALRKKTIYVQSRWRALRAIAARKEFRFRKQTKASIIIQARWRCHKAAVYYKRLKRGAIVTQCRWRGRVARRELRKLKMMQHIQPVARGKRTKGGVADVDAAARIFTTGMKLCVWWIYTCKQKFRPNESNMLIRNEGFDRA
ncbi:hypothetical protein RIF29_12820 [Crotalaria pallida]|uniref:Myosin motor domain-containing protein n=1 Tax=Crotalaria pallida TaxID=3830 RepID=A0AAN9INV0_CROPI